MQTERFMLNFYYNKEVKVIDANEGAFINETREL